MVYISSKLNNQDNIVVPPPLKKALARYGVGFVIFDLVCDVH